MDKEVKTIADAVISKQTKKGNRKSNTKSYEEQVGIMIQEKEEDVNNAIKLLENPKIKMNDVAKKLNINRSTINRNESVKKMIDEANEKLVAMTRSFKNDNEVLRQLETENAKLKKRDQDYMILKYQYNELVALVKGNKQNYVNN